MTKSHTPSPKSFDDLPIKVEIAARRVVTKGQEKALAKATATAGLDHGEYLFVHPADLDELLRETIGDLLWAFNAGFLASETGLPLAAFEAIQKAELCEDANPAMRALIDATCGLTQFAADAVQADGAGHFLASYNCNETKLTVKVGGRTETWTAYRTN